MQPRLTQTSLFAALLLLLALLATTATQAAEVTLRTDRSTIHADESFQLIFSSDEEIDAQPDFKPLERLFDIVNQNSSTSLKIINGRRSFTQSWILTLMPRASGNFTVPVIDFGIMHSRPLQIRILPATDANASPEQSDLLLEVTTDTNQLYVQGQLILTLRIKHAVPLAGGSLSEPELSDADAIVERLGEDRNFETRVGGRPFSVIERRYAIFPQHSGSLTIEPVKFDAQVALSSRRTFDPFQRTQQRRILGEKLTIDVLPIPDGYSGKQWLPAQNLQLVEEWPEQEAKSWRAGEPITRTLAIMADGLTSAQLPPIDMPVPDGIKAYPDQPAQTQQTGDQGLIAIRQEKVALIPTRAGRYTLPAMQIAWWNMATGKEEIAQLPAREVEVAAAALQPDPMATPSADGADGSSTTPASNWTPSTSETGLNGQPIYWMISTGLFALLWLLTLLMWWRSGREERAIGAQQTLRGSNLRQIRKALQHACATGEIEAVRPLLLQLGEQLWPQDPPANLKLFAQRCGTPMPEALEALNAALYAPNTGAWQGERLWSAIEQCCSLDKPVAHKGGLKPLYPSQPYIQPTFPQ